MAQLQLSSRALHIAMSTYPIGEEDNYLPHIEQMYSQYIEDREKFTSLRDPESDYFLYKPLKYHLFGHFDVALLSIIDSYKFAQRVFDNSNSENKTKNKISYQIQCGTILVNSIVSDEAENEFKKHGIKSIYDNFPFIQIINLKLNNGLLIGNGNSILNLTLKTIQRIFKKHVDLSYIISNSYNWSDLTITLFARKSQTLFKTIIDIRKLVLENLFEKSKIDESIISNSLYNKKFGYTSNEILNSHLFVDTQSTLGVSYDLFKLKNNNPNNFINHYFPTQIEWQIKPGHFSSFYAEINKSSQVLSNEDCFYKNGKTDFILKESSPKTLRSNQDIFFALRNSDAKNHIRKILTKPLYNISPEEIDHKSICVTDILDKLNRNKIDLTELSTALKRINLSRQLRTKIQKVYHNYNNGITDSISYIYFIDFRKFLKFFEFIILECSRQINSILENNSTKKLSILENYYNIDELENIFDIILQSFEEAYIDRFLNNYNFEELNDFKLDFNTSVTQIITTYDAIIEELSETLLSDKAKILVRQNELNTKSNFVSINFNVYHLIEPPLIFNTVVKELLNSRSLVPKDISQDIFRESSYDEQIREDYNNQYGKNPFFDDFDLMYFKIDVIKYFYTFNANTELYFFWSWVYFLQNTSSYNTIGYINDFNFNRELFRILLIIATFDQEILESDQLKCPVPELESYWETAYPLIKNTVIRLIKLTSFDILVSDLFKIYKDEIIESEYPNGSPLVHQRFAQKDVLNANYIQLMQVFEEKRKGGLLRKKYTKFQNNENNLYLVDRRWESLELSYIHFSERLEAGEVLNFSKGNSEFSEPTGSMFFNRLSYTTLLWYYNKMNKEINLLRRDYNTGEPMREFLKLKEKNYIFIDPQGDFFITNYKARKETMIFKHAVYQSLWHLGLVLKVESFI